jgi:hypothetical protein
MAKAGYCSECGRNVRLTPEGACGSGHGPECVSGAYEASEPPSATEQDVPPVPTPVAGAGGAAAEGQPVYPSMPALPVTPPRNRTGLVVIVVVILLLLLACVLGGPVLFQAITKTTAPKQATASPARAKITATLSFMEALLVGDIKAAKPFLTDAAQKSVDETGWADIASASPTATVAFSAPKWSGDTTAVVTFSNAETSGTITFGIDTSKPDVVIMNGVSTSGSERDVIGLVKEGGEWRILSLDNGAGDVTTFDAEFVKSMLP